MKRVLFAPICIAILGFVGVLIAEYRVNTQIEHETQQLLALGIDVRPARASDNAWEDYRLLLPDRISTFPDAENNDDVLAKLEIAAKKPFLQPPVLRDGDSPDRFRLSSWILRNAAEAEKRGDFQRLDRIFDLSKASALQAIRSDREPHSFSPYHSNFMGVFGTFLRKPKVSTWLRKRIETTDWKPFLTATLAREGRAVRFGYLKVEENLHPGIAKSKSWWEKFVESQVIFKRGVDLAKLRSIRSIAEKRLSEPIEKGLRFGIQTDIQNQLLSDNTWQGRVAWAQAATTEYETDVLRDRNISLILIDIQEQMRIPEKPEPTWSSKYCIDPISGAKIKVEVKGDRINLSSSSSQGSWRSGYQLPKR